MYRNNEGIPDPTPGQAISNIRWEELQKEREKEHGLKRGEFVTVKTVDQAETQKGETKIKLKTYRVIELYKHCVLLADEHGGRTAPPYTKLRRMMQK